MEGIGLTQNDHSDVNGKKYCLFKMFTDLQKWIWVTKENLSTNLRCNSLKGEPLREAEIKQTLGFCLPNGNLSWLSKTNTIISKSEAQKLWRKY